MATIDPIDDIKLEFVARLNEQMPTMADGPDSVPVFYAFPGDDLLGKEAVFLSGSRADYSVEHLRAVTRRRTIRAQFDLAVQVLVEGPSEDTDDRSGPPPQYIADRRARELWSYIEARIAVVDDLARLGSPQYVDSAWVVRTELQFGTHDHGPWSRLIATIGLEYSIV